METKAFNAVHNFGSKLWLRTNGKKGIPQRQFMYISEKASKKIIQAVRAFMRKETTGK